MEPEFWHERWAAGQTGFHQGATNAFLERYWPSLGLAPGSRICVPLCGKSLDMLWLQQQGFAVAGIEISPLAVEAFFTENGLQPVRSEGPAHTRWSADGIDLYCGDFFALDSNMTGALDGCYDRAALVALPVHLRRAYAEHLAGLLPAQSRSLLVTMEYAQAGMDGPPFSVPPAEVHTLFTPGFTVEQLHAAEVLDNYPAFRERGLNTLGEHVFRLTKK